MAAKVAALGALTAATIGIAEARASSSEPKPDVTKFQSGTGGGGRCGCAPCWGPPAPPRRRRRRSR
jgi:hypothetical protein